MNYKEMLPAEYNSNKLGYYPVTSKEEWEALPDLYKTMEWYPVKDPHHKGTLSAVKSVIFDVLYMDPYGIHAKVYVHPSEVHKILFCLFKDTDCHLYSISGIELESGTRLSTKWQQDTTTGAFAVYCGGTPVARQGGFLAYVPESVQRTEDGTFKYDFHHTSGKICYYTLLNPFDNLSFRDRSRLIAEEKGSPVESNSNSELSISISRQELAMIQDTLTLAEGSRKDLDGNNVPAEAYRSLRERLAAIGEEPERRQPLDRMISNADSRSEKSICMNDTPLKEPHR